MIVAQVYRFSRWLMRMGVRRDATRQFIRYSHVTFCVFLVGLYFICRCHPGVIKRFEQPPVALDWRASKMLIT